MDIYKWAEEYNWAADYMDSYTGTVYACTEYKKNPDLPGIPAYVDGKLTGHVKRIEDNKR